MLIQITKHKRFKYHKPIESLLKKNIMLKNQKKIVKEIQFSQEFIPFTFLGSPVGSIWYSKTLWF